MTNSKICAIFNTRNIRYLYEIYIMSNITLNFDREMEQEISELKKHFHASSKAEVIRKALGLLKVAKKVQETDGELIARKDNKETLILVR